MKESKNLRNYKERTNHCFGAGGAGGDESGVGCIIVGFGTTYGCIGEGDPHADTCRECPTFAIN